MSESLFVRKMKAAKSYAAQMKRLWHPCGKTAYLLGTPTHKNIGDSAIVVAEINFLKKCGYESVVEITVKEYQDNRKCIVRLMPPRADIFFHGGGNMGDLWPMEEIWRSQMIDDFASHKIVVFPQTIFYSDTPDGEKMKEKSVSIYNTKKSLTLAAREEISFDQMRQLYPRANVILSPDIVLSMQQPQRRTERSGILACFRRDREQALSNEEEAGLMNTLRNIGYQVEQTDMMADVPITVDNRRKIVESKLSQFAAARLIITDRLHGMVFAAITQTPCIVLGNNHHKVRGTYEWLKHLDYIHFVDSIEEIPELAKTLYQKANCHFYLDPKLFSDLENSVRRLRGNWS